MQAAVYPTHSCETLKVSLLMKCVLCVLYWKHYLEIKEVAPDETARCLDWSRRALALNVLQAMLGRQ